jgi:hypothetical protein
MVGGFSVCADKFARKFTSELEVYGTSSQSESSFTPPRPVTMPTGTLSFRVKFRLWHTPARTLRLTCQCASLSAAACPGTAQATGIFHPGGSGHGQVPARPAGGAAGSGSLVPVLGSRGPTCRVIIMATQPRMQGHASGRVRAARRRAAALRLRGHRDRHRSFSLSCHLLSSS